jgi:hypothetical protein
VEHLQHPSITVFNVKIVTNPFTGYAGIPVFTVSKPQLVRSFCSYYFIQLFFLVFAEETRPAATFANA